MGQDYQDYIRHSKPSKGERYIKDYAKVLGNGSIELYSFPDPNVRVSEQDMMNFMGHYPKA